VVERSKNRPTGAEARVRLEPDAALKRRSSTVLHAVEKVLHAVETVRANYRSAEALRHPKAEYQRLKAQVGLSSYGMPFGFAQGRL
jgi:hypothetical protein